MNLGIENKLALVSGSTRGIGYATARMLAREGAHVVVNGRASEAVDRAVATLSKHGAVTGVAADLATAAGAQLLSATCARIGHVDILVNNVGYFEVKPFTEIPDDEWLAMFQLNVMSGVRLSRAFLPGMVAHNWGRVVFIGSDQSAKPNPGMLHYALTKAAQVSLARGLADEFTKGTQVTVNSLLVAPTWSEGVETFLGKVARAAGKTVEEMRTAYFEDTGRSSLLQRWAHPDEIAAHIAFLCSERASMINGAAHRCDGGIVRSIF